MTPSRFHALLAEDRYVPDRIPAGVTTANAIIQQCIAVCQRVHEALPEMPEFAGHAGHADRQAGRNALSKAAKPVEAKALRAWAVKNRRMLDDHHFEQNWESDGSRGESENDVYFDEASQRWYKRNSLMFHSTYLEFFQRLAMHEHLFPEAPLRMEGFVVHDGALLPILSQPDVRSRAGAEREAVEARMKELGFVREKGDDYYNPQTGVRVEDLHNENVLVDEEGHLHVIDPAIYLDDRGKAARLAAPFHTITEASSSLGAEADNSPIIMSITHDGPLSSDVYSIMRAELHGVDKEPAYAAILNNKVVGGIAANWYEDDERDGAYIFGFDVAVSPQFRRTGIAKMLIQAAISDYDKYKHQYGAQVLRLYVIHKHLADYLLTLGFEVVEDCDGGWLLERP